ncbi:hypothetical protein [Micromonospora sp. NBRC 101691]|uniref:hypothetical protein n=1 Tax=Micromonospora sp. NBRC 101691 TaxID=3032198 RepID=UPI0024A48256|nr:hypothetical protein [Micromonospora sp. NBRC 101691]GLY23784.1 hypothetical protein Misp04_35160 [Micromonospora sp. NBRC 101691]
MQRPIPRSTRTGTVAVLCAGLLLTQGCAADPDGQPAAAPSAGPTTGPPSGEPSAPPSATTSSAPTGSPSSGGGGGGDDAILQGERQVVIAPVDSFESILAVDPKGRLNLTDGEAEYTLFVLDPVAGRHQIKTAKAGSGGEPFCMGLRDNGTKPKTIVSAGCDTSAAGQLFTLERMKDTDEKGRPTYAIRGDGDVYVRTTATDGLVAELPGDEGPGTTFVFVDNGKANLPALD